MSKCFISSLAKLPQFFLLFSNTVIFVIGTSIASQLFSHKVYFQGNFHSVYTQCGFGSQLPS